MRILRVAVVAMAAAMAAAAPGGGAMLMQMRRDESRRGQEHAAKRYIAAFTSSGWSMRGRTAGMQRCAARPVGVALEMKVNVWDRVKIHYTGRRQDGTEFDSSRTRMKPFEFTVGLQEVIPGIERVVQEMEVGERRKEVFQPEEAFGQRSESLLLKVASGTIPPDANLPVGSQIQLPNGKSARVASVEEDGSFTIDINHELAGQTVSYEIELLERTEPKKVSSSGFSLERIPLEDQFAEASSKGYSDITKRVVFSHGTEMAFTGKTVDGTSYNSKEEGTYVCAVGGLPLFSSDHKYDSGTGWPSFYQPVDPDHIIERIDTSAGMTRVEVMCARTGAHLGHVFPDGPEPTGKRYCINAAALKFIPKGEQIK